MLWGPRSRIGLTAALATAAFDQALKLWLYYGFDLPGRGQVRVAPFLDLVLIWNKGISYGLFQQEGPLGQWVLLGLKFAAVALLWIWIARSESRLTALSLGLIIGGAMGNAIDQLHWLDRGVMDFLLFHLTVAGQRYNWYVFNWA